MPLLFPRSVTLSTTMFPNFSLAAGCHLPDYPRGSGHGRGVKSFKLVAEALATIKVKDLENGTNH